MEVKASARYIRISPRKVRLVVSLVRGMKLASAYEQLKFVGKGAAEPVRKAIASAAANAVHNFELSEENLLVKEIRVDGGPVLKRWLPRAHGHASPLRKRMSHIMVTLGEIKDSGVKAGRKEAAEAPMKLGAAPKEDEGIKTETKAAGRPNDPIEDKAKKIVDPRREGRANNNRNEGGGKQGFTSKLFNRKSG